MKKIILGTAFLLFYILPSVAISFSELSNYPGVLIKSIATGDKEGEFGLEISDNPRQKAFPGPIAFSQNGDAYIFDIINERINIYNNSFQYISIVNLSNQKSGFFTFYIENMVIDEHENIIVISFGVLGKELIVINKEGQYQKLLESDTDTQLDLFNKYNFFSIDNKILFYVKNEPQIIDIPITMNKSKTIKQAFTTYYIDIVNKGTKITDEITDKNRLFDFLEKNQAVMKGNRFLNKDYNKYEKFKTFLKSNYGAHKSKEKFNITNENIDSTFLGFDNDDNIYWNARFSTFPALLIYNKYGELIDALKPQFSGNPAISPAGDIYYLDVNTIVKKVNIYKVSRRW